MALVGVYLKHPTLPVASCHVRNPCFLAARLLGYYQENGREDANGYITPQEEGVWADNCCRCFICESWINWADRVER